MAKFKYIALDKEGRELSGVIESTSENRARKDLAAQGFSVSRIAEVAAIASEKKASGGKAKKPLFGTGVGKENITVFSRQLSTLLKAGLPLLRSLEVIARQEKNPYFKAIVDQLADNVRTGNKFSDGLSQHPKIFDKLYVNMAKAGEAGGVLDVVLDRLSTFQEKALKTTNKVKSAMVYPIVIMGVAVAIVAILMIFVVPQFQKIFTDMLKGNARMPALTQTIIDISDFMKENYILTGLIIVGVILFVKIFFKTKIGIRVWDTAALKLPKIGDLVMKSTVARFTRTFGTLLASGVPILEALTITRGTINNSLISEALSRVHDRVRDGENLSTPLDQQKIFPTMVTSMVEVGEETGQLPEMLNRIADNYDEEVDNSVGAITSIIEPIMIVFLALVVGTIVIALFLPIIQIIQNLTGG
ncbi:MAG: pilus assembly protein PilC [Verrucomicrobia bacterium CAG:312_58_20]|nr:MAG: pilus assembly protein PilC [Verrucomicrobia bacterium CAG:312_58_20]PWL69001.1 MAG: pilus assembly protein PilC [Verrucomicrobiota bacterium]